MEAAIDGQSVPIETCKTTNDQEDRETKCKYSHQANKKKKIPSKRRLCQEHSWHFRQIFAKLPFPARAWKPWLLPRQELFDSVWGHLLSSPWQQYIKIYTRTSRQEEQFSRKKRKHTTTIAAQQKERTVPTVRPDCVHANKLSTAKYLMQLTIPLCPPLFAHQSRNLHRGKQICKGLPVTMHNGGSSASSLLQGRSLSFLLCRVGSIRGKMWTLIATRVAGTDSGCLTESHQAVAPRGSE